MLPAAARAVAAGAIAFSAACASPADSRAPEPPIDASELAIPRYMPRFGRARAVVAVVAYSPATELTDFVVPYGVLAESGVAEVVAVATSPGPIQMRPALRFEAEETLGDFEADFPEGADYVIVPNIYEGEDDPELLEWIRRQARTGATIVGVCDGVPTLAKAGVLEGRRATTHWNTIDRLEEEHPETHWIRNRRYLADGNVITTSGVSASIPISIALIEAIGGRERAEMVAQRLGVVGWGPEHNSDQFRLRAGSLFTALRNKAMFWRHEELGVEIAPGVDEIRVALIADAYGRTRRSAPVTVARSTEPVPTRRGLTILPDRSSGGPGAPSRMLSLMDTLPPVQTLDRSLEAIARRYGEPTAAFVALTMEYAWRR